MFWVGFIFSRAGWLWPMAGAFLVALGLLAWGYRTVPTGFLRWVCPVLKLAGLAALAFCLLEPLGSGQRARAGANEFLIVADNSQRLRIKDRGATHTRGESLLQLLDPQHGSWQSALEENFDVRRYSFDARVQNSKDFSELKF